MAAFERGFRPEVVVGTSVGALNGAWVALHPDRPADLLKIWLAMDQFSLVDWHPARIATRLIRNPLSAAPNDVVRKLIQANFGDARFDDTVVDLGVVATNLTKGEKHVFRSGSLRRAILASTAIPGVFEPVTIGTDQFVDGCVTANVDMASALEMGATEIFAIDLTPAPQLAHPRTAVGVLRQSFSILSTAATRAVEACVSQQMPVRMARPDLSGNSAWKLTDSAGAIAHNLRLAHEALAGVFDEDGRVAPTGTCWIGPAAETARAQVRPVEASRFFGGKAVRKAG
jgi:NTE family protein